MTRPIAFLKRSQLSAALAVGLLLTSLSPMVLADPTGPAPRDRQVALIVSSMLKREHLTKHPFDQEITKRTLTQYFKMLDPMKVYFYQSDVDKFMARAKEVEKVQRGETSLAYEIFQTFIKRVDERMKFVEQLLATTQDFTSGEEMVTDRDAIPYPKDEAEAQDRWRMRIKRDLLVLRADHVDEVKERAEIDKRKREGKPVSPEIDATVPSEVKSPEEQAKADVVKLKKRYHAIAARWHQIDSEDLLEMYLTSLCSSFDPHTSYMSPETEDNFQIQMRLQLQGIGAALRSEDGETVVEKLVPGGAAEKEGRLKVGDKILAVGQNASGPMQDVAEMKLSDVVKLIRGTSGTLVRLEVVSRGSKEKKIIPITRAKIELKDSEARAKIFEASKKPDGKPYRIGVIDLPSFYMDMEGARQGLPNFKSTTRDVRRILDDFNRQGVDAVALDLRRNGGGSLQEAISLTGLFIGEGPVVQVKDSDGRITPYNDTDGSMVWRGPLVVLISKFSASASEILAGAIQDYHRGLIIGDRSTHGKGTVQSLTDLSDLLFRNSYSTKLGSLKITMQQFYRPSGDSTQRRGVVADLELPSLTTHYEGISEADLDYAVPFDQIPAQTYRPFNLVEKAIVDKLKQISTDRIGKSTDFSQVLKRIARYEDQRKKKRVTLNEQKYLAERAEWNSDKEEEKKFEELDGRNTDIKRDYYLNEVLAITSDYMNALGQPENPSLQAAQTAKPASAN